jgi:signal transduction histidine kinase
VTTRSLRSRLVGFLTVWAVIVAVFMAIAGYFHLNRTWTWRLHFAFPIILGLLFVAFGVMVVRRGLAPFRTMRERLNAVRDGRNARLDGDYPSEVGPLVNDLNALLDERENRVIRAVARAGDLAHGLKTPLAVLAQDIERADASGQHELAASMRQQVERMQRQINSHLAQARVTMSVAGVSRTGVFQAAAGLVRTMERLYESRALTIDVSVPADCDVQVPVEDLEEMLGNLLDNACKWARTRLCISASSSEGVVVINVDDDGPGLDASLRQQVLQRGVRADEAAPGSGLGLSIVRDLAEAYGGSIRLIASPLGGVCAQLSLKP